MIAAIALQHYRFGPDNPTLPLKLERDFSPRCDWSRYGLAFTAYDPDAPGDTRMRLRWVSFGRPVYDGQGAEVETAIMHGPLAGTGYRCRVISGSPVGPSRKDPAGEPGSTRAGGAAPCDPGIARRRGLR
ncbi:MAG: hypothetical protein HZY74_03795 [Brevundimonas sp.]|nr:MAG: hypothetical protein HZY74_03795 [Brevundimonas sp.]